MNLNGSNKIRLTYDNKTNPYPQFLPDGSKIVFISANGDNWIFNISLRSWMSGEQTRNSIDWGSSAGAEW